MKLRSFLFVESLALAILLVSLYAGVAAQIRTEAIADFLRLLPIAAAFMVAVLPILYFALPARLPREESSNESQI
jgi:hypothetical protein